MSLTKFVQKIVPELREAISDPAHTLTAAERFTLWEILAQIRASVVEGSTRILPATQESGVSSPYTPPFWAHVAAELRSMHAQLGVVGPPPPETSDSWHQAMWRLRQQMDELLRQIDVPSEFVDAETRLQDALGYLFWVGNYIDRWRDALRHLEAHDTKLHDLANDMGYQASLIRVRAKLYGYRETSGESTPSPVVLPPTTSEREDMLLGRLWEHMRIMRDWAESLLIAPDRVEIARVADRMHRYIVEDRRWMVEHGYEVSSE